MDQAPTMYSVSNSTEPQYDGLNPGYGEFSGANFAREGFPVSPATSYEAALLSAPHPQPGTYPAYAPATHAMEYVHNMYHMQFAHDMVHSYSENLPSLPYGARTIITSDGKRKRRRIITHDQRKAANVRERRRMYHLNEAFDDLRKRVPTFAYEKKLSRIETLKLAVTYIQFMSEMLEDMDPALSSGATSPVPESELTEQDKIKREERSKIRELKNAAASMVQSLGNIVQSHDDVVQSCDGLVEPRDDAVRSRDVAQSHEVHSQRLTDILQEISNEQEHGLEASDSNH